MKLSVILLRLLLLLSASHVNAMEFSKTVVGGGTLIRATGPIELGDAEQFERIAPGASVDSQGLRRIILDSPGGYVSEAKRIAKIIKSYNFVTLVEGECASACAMVLYPAGRYFMLLDGGKLGFHSCYSARNLVELPECTERIAYFAADNGFPYGSVKVFASLAGPTQMHWITNVLAYCYGMEHFIGDPAPVSVSNICPKTYIALIEFREANRPLGPSFDCRRASEPIEVFLCRDPELMHLDALMGQLYRMMRRREGFRDTALLFSQRAWIIQRDKKCPVSFDLVASRVNSRDAARCISEMTMARMEKLLELNGTPRIIFSDLDN